MEMDSRYLAMLESRGIMLQTTNRGPWGAYIRVQGFPVALIRRDIPGCEQNWVACHEAAHHDLNHGELADWWLAVGSNRIKVEGQADRRALHLAFPIQVVAKYYHELRRPHLCDDYRRYLMYCISEETKMPHRIVRRWLNEAPVIFGTGQGRA